MQLEHREAFEDEASLRALLECHPGSASPTLHRTLPFPLQDLVMTPCLATPRTVRTIIVGATFVREHPTHAWSRTSHGTERAASAPRRI